MFQCVCNIGFRVNEEQVIDYYGIVFIQVGVDVGLLL